MAQHFDLPAIERQCLDTTWKKDPSLLLIINGFADGLQDGTQMGYLIVNGQKLSIIGEIPREQDLIQSSDYYEELQNQKNPLLPDYSTVPVRGGKGKVGIKKDLGTGKNYLYAEFTFTLW